MLAIRQAPQFPSHGSLHNAVPPRDRRSASANQHPTPPTAAIAPAPQRQFWWCVNRCGSVTPVADRKVLALGKIPTSSSAPTPHRFAPSNASPNGRHCILVRRGMSARQNFAPKLISRTFNVPRAFMVECRAASPLPTAQTGSVPGRFLVSVSLTRLKTRSPCRGPWPVVLWSFSLLVCGPWSVVRNPVVLQSFLRAFGFPNSSFCSDSDCGHPYLYGWTADVQPTLA